MGCNNVILYISLLTAGVFLAKTYFHFSSKLPTHNSESPSDTQIIFVTTALS